MFKYILRRGTDWKNTGESGQGDKCTKRMKEKKKRVEQWQLDEHMKGMLEKGDKVTKGTTERRKDDAELRHEWNHPVKFQRALYISL